MSTPNDTFAEKISNLLQQNWDSNATGLEVADVFWSHDKFDTMNQVEQVNQKAIISTYNPQNPVAVEVLSPETNIIHETIVIDVILHVAVLGGTDRCIAVRESARQLILKILHTHQMLLPGANLMNVEGEYMRGELPQIQRETFKVVASFFEVSPL